MIYILGLRIAIFHLAATVYAYIRQGIQIRFGRVSIALIHTLH